MNEPQSAVGVRGRGVEVKSEPSNQFLPQHPTSDSGLSKQQQLLRLSLPAYSDPDYHQLQQQQSMSYLEKLESTLTVPLSISTATGSTYCRPDSYPSYSPGSSNSASMQLPASANDGNSPGPDGEREESPPPPPRVYKPCVVCLDKSSGYHYGVSSCEGCKGFFRRSVQKNMQYTCQKDNNCEINKTTRNRCQHCRLRKCFEKGMSKEAVRNDRNKKRKKEDVDDSSSSASKDQSDEPSATTSSHLSDADKELIDLVLRAHVCTLPGHSPGSASARSPQSSTSGAGVSNSQQGFGAQAASVRSSLVDGLVELPRGSPAATLFSESSSSAASSGSPAVSSGVQSPAAADSPLTCSVKTVVWESIKELSSEGIVKVVDFAKHLPCFTALHISDQITLLKAACLEIMILRLCMRYSKDCNSLAFTNGTMVTREELDSGGFGPLAHSVFDFAQALANLKLDETEFALLAAICLISGDRYGLQDAEKVEKLQERFIEALRHYLLGHRPCEHLLFAKLLMKVTDLRSISVKGAERVLHLRMEATHDIPPLVAEMLHRTENVCIP